MGRQPIMSFLSEQQQQNGKFSCTCSEIQRTVTNDMFPYLVKQPLSHTFLFLTYRPVIQKNYFKHIQSFLVFLAAISKGTQKALELWFLSKLIQLFLFFFQWEIQPDFRSKFGRLTYFIFHFGKINSSL